MSPVTKTARATITTQTIRRPPIPRSDDRPTGSRAQPRRSPARRLRFPDIDGEQTRASVTAGVLSFGVGCFKAIRNPLGHLPDDQHDITEPEALEQLAAWSLFARWIERAQVEQPAE